MTRRPGTTAAVAVGVAAVVALSAGGGAVAQTLITGQQIKDGTVTGADLRDGTVRAADVGDGSLTGTDITNSSLRSADVADGSLRGTDIANGSIASADVAGGYYTKAEIDSRFQTSGSLNLPGYAFIGANVTQWPGGCVGLSSGTAAFASVQVPTGVTITGLTANVVDLNISRTVTVSLFKATDLLAEASTGNILFGEQLISDGLDTPEAVEGQESFYLSFSPSEAGDQFGLRVCSVSINYTMP